MANIHTVSDWPYATTLRGFDEYLFYQFMERPEKSETLLNIKDSSQYQEDIVTAGGVESCHRNSKVRLLSTTS